MTDPGAWSTEQNDQKNIHLILITHEHPDHLHLESLKAVLNNNPDARVITNSAVGKLLEEAGIKYELVEHGGGTSVSGVDIEGHGEKHGVIYGDYGQVKNTGYFISDRFFYPGDALFDPKKPVEILALPVAGPWMKVPEAMEYAIKLKPKHAFPVHDGMLKYYISHHSVPEMYLPKFEIDFKVLELLKEYSY